jgi:glycosyltransferase involved in cell wall biosynthesis
LRSAEDIDKPEVELVEVVNLLRGGGHGGLLPKLFYPLWWLVVFLGILLRERPGLVFCLGFETLLPVWVASWFCSVEYVFDDADRFSMTVSLPSMVKPWLERLEEKIAEGAVVHIVPGSTRYREVTKNMAVLMNTPLGEEIAEALAGDLSPPDESVVFYINGYLAHGRGLPLMFRLAKALIGRTQKVRFYLAGHLNCPEAEEMVKMENVYFSGSVTQLESLRLCRQSSLVVTLYDPSAEVNLHAESNKWGDAVAMGVPVLVNREIFSARPLRDANACIEISYGEDAERLAERVLGWLEEPAELEQARVGIRRLQEEQIPFDEGMGAVLQRLRRHCYSDSNE